MNKRFMKVIGVGFILLCISFFFSEKRVSAFTLNDKNSNYPVEKFDVSLATIEKERVSSIVRQNSQFTIKKNDLKVVNNVYVYHASYRSFDGKFNVGYDIIIKNNKIIAAGEPWEKLYGLNVVYKELKLISPTKATYFLNITNGCRNWNQGLVTTITNCGDIGVYLYYF